jgi:hypothetical protein
MIDNKKFAYELKYKHRFVVKFPEQFGINEWAIKTINKPKFTHTQWENIKIEFIDPIGPSTSAGLFNIIEFIRLGSCDNAVLFEIKILSLDPAGGISEEWVVYVDRVLTINFGELDYDNDDIQKPFLIIKPLSCVLK